MRLNLPFPAPELWPNGRPHHMAKAREAKKARALAFCLALSQKDSVKLSDGPVPVKLTVHPKPYGPAPDKDNCSAALKSFTDGIAQAIGVNDRHFAAPVVTIAERKPGGAFVVEIGG